MENKVTKIIFRQDTSQNLTSVNPILSLGEPCVDITTGTFKIGDGVTPWNSLPVLNTPNVIAECPDTGYSYLRTRAPGAPLGSWVQSDTRKTLVDLLNQPYGQELDMGYQIQVPSSIGLDNTIQYAQLQVYGMRFALKISAEANTTDTQVLISGNVFDIQDFGGTVTTGDGSKIYVTNPNSNCLTSLYVDTNNNLNLSTLCTADRLNNIIDIWVIYTKLSN